MTFLTRLAAALLFVTLGASVSRAADKAIIVLDASGSMWGQIDGRPKLEIAREALRTVLRSVPADREIGLMAYGHRDKGNCSDIELVVPPAVGTANAISAAADQMKFLGKTPLTAAVRQAAEDLSYTEDTATVILITDGLETCNADPCALGKELEQSGVDFTAHVVGFGLTADEGNQVACLAENTGGQYIQASDASQLQEALQETVVARPAPAPAPEPAPEAAKPEFNFIPSIVMAEGEAPLGGAGQAYEIYRASADGSKGDRITTEYNSYKGDLEPGDYIIRAVLDQASVEQPLKVEAGKTYQPAYVLNAGRLVIRPRPSPGAEIDPGAAVVVHYPGADYPGTWYGEAKIALPAGEQQLTVKIGSGEAKETIQLAAGQTIEKDIVVGVGHAVTNALYAKGGDKVDNSGLFVRIAKAEKRIDGSRDDVVNGYGPDQKFDLPPGDYVAIVKAGEAEVEQPFTVKAGEVQDITAILNAGVLAISAPGAKFIEVFDAGKSIDGNRKGRGNAYADTYQATLPAGDYTVSVERGDNASKTEANTKVKAGERTEVKLP